MVERRNPHEPGRLWRGCLGATLALLCTVAAHAKDKPNFEGTWKIQAPITRLMPLAPVKLTEAGRKRLETNQRLMAAQKYDDYDIMKSRCSNPGVPRLMLTSMRFKIWQRFDVLTFDYEWNRALRQIDARGVPVEPLLVPQMTGQTTARWEGDTLVAQTVDVSERTLIDDIMPHSSDMKVMERLRLINANTLEDRITIEDPAFYAEPWTAVVTYKRVPDELFPEHVCLDGRTQAPPSSAVK